MMKKGHTSCRMPGIILFAICGVLFQMVQAASPRGEYSMYELRDAFLSLDGTMRNYGDKLERHEGRERQLGDTLRRALAGVDKRVALLQRSSEEKYRELERFLIQGEERERIQLQKATQNVESLGSMFEARLSNIEALLQSNSKLLEQKLTPNCMNLLEPKVEQLKDKIGSLEEIVKNGAKEIINIAEATKRTEESLNVNINKSSHILGFLTEMDINGRKESNDDNLSSTEEMKVLISEVSRSLALLIDEAKEIRTNMLHTNERSMKILTHLLEKMDSIEQGEQLVQKLNDAQNATLAAIGQVKMESGKVGISSVREEITVLNQMTEVFKNEVHRELLNVGTQIGHEAKETRDVIVRKLDSVKEELSPEPLHKTLSDMEHVMLQAADGVMDVGRRVEHGNLRVINELGEEIRSTSSSIETKLSTRLDNLAASVLVNQTGAMETLSQKVESEISQVWRQIGIMYQQLTQSVGMLDKLQVQTENYVNGSLKSMGSVEGRVGEIRERVGEVEVNLNFLLGRLSLVATEFNLIKAGLAEALDDVRRNMASVNSDIREAPKGTEYDHVNQVSPAQ